MCCRFIGPVIYFSDKHLSLMISFSQSNKFLLCSLSPRDFIPSLVFFFFVFFLYRKKPKKKNIYKSYCIYLPFNLFGFQISLDFVFLGIGTGIASFLRKLQQMFFICDILF